MTLRNDKCMVKTKNYNFFFQKLLDNNKQKNIFKDVHNIVNVNC